MSGCANGSQPAPEHITKNVQTKQEVVYHKESLTKDEIKKQKASDIYNSLPKWVINEGHIEDGVGAIGTAKMTGSRTIKHVRNYAMSDARKNFAKQVLTELSGSFTDKLEDTTTNENTNVIEGIKDELDEVLKTVKLSGASPRKSYLAKDGTMYVWLTISTNTLDKYSKSVSKKLEEKVIQNAQNQLVRDEAKKVMNHLNR